MRLQCLLPLIVTLCLAGPVNAQRIELRLRPPGPAGERPVSAEADVEEVARLLVEKTNALRRQEGRAALAINRQLSAAAHDFAGFMAEGDKYGHTADGHDPADRAVAAGYEYCIVAENIAWLSHTAGFTSEELATDLFQGWQRSPEHLRNLLDPQILEIGVAVAKSKKTGRYYGVQEFGRPRSAQIEFEVCNSTDEELTYRIDAKRFTLEPRYGRQHTRCVPPALEMPGNGKQAEREATFHPRSGDRYIARRDHRDRIAIETVGREPKQASGTASGRRD